MNTLRAWVAAYLLKAQLIRYNLLHKLTSHLSLMRSYQASAVIWPVFNEATDQEHLHSLAQRVEYYLHGTTVGAEYFVRSGSKVNRVVYDQSRNQWQHAAMVSDTDAMRRHDSARYLLVWKTATKTPGASIFPYRYVVEEGPGKHAVNEWLRLITDTYRGSDKGTQLNSSIQGTRLFNTCAVLGSGPSLELFYSEFERWDTWVAAASIVGDDRIFSCGRPFALCFIDPYYLTANESLQTLLRRIILFIRQTSSLLITTLGFRAFIETHLPVDIQSNCKYIRTLGHHGFCPKPKLDINNLYVTPYGNVLTDLLLPVGASISKTLVLYGCDGRPNGMTGNFPKAAALQDSEQAIIQDLSNTFTADYYDPYIERNALYTYHAVRECMGRGVKMMLRCPTWNQGLQDLPVLGNGARCQQFGRQDG